MRFRSRLLRLIDKCISPFINYKTRSVISRFSGAESLLLLGGGGTLKYLNAKMFGRETVCALLNYTIPPTGQVVDFLLLSDHYVFDFKQMKATMTHLYKVAPRAVILPSRSLFSLVGLFIMCKYPTIFVRYYGSPLWESECTNFRCTLFDELLSYDTVAFEFGLPLGETLGVSTVILAGVDLSYGEEEDLTPFRVKWRSNIKASVNMALQHYSFSVYKIHKDGFGDLPIYEASSE